MTETWSITSHVCITCFGRILARKPAAGRTMFRCSNCGAEAEGYGRAGGTSHPSNCACGSTLNGRDAGIRCVANDNIVPECPAEIIVRDAPDVPRPQRLGGEGLEHLPRDPVSGRPII